MQQTTELIKTLAAVVVAGLACLLVFLFTGGPDFAAPSEEVGDYFFEFDPIKATSLEIVEYLPSTARVKDLKVEKNSSGVWVIPSHYNYPTDAKNRLGEAANAIRGLKRGTVVSDKRSDHEQFGVVDPKKEIEAGTSGIGTRVSIGQDGKEIAAIIIGKADGELRYVRIPEQDNVYLAKVDVSKLSTKFEDWIEVDLLKIQGFALNHVEFTNYSFDPVAWLRKQDIKAAFKPGDLLRVNYFDEKPAKEKWGLDVLEPEDGIYRPAVYATGEELNVEVLDTMKNSFNDLKIVDVREKPAALVAAIKGKSQGVTTAVFEDLAQRGFFITPEGFFAKEGEMVICIEDGVQYRLRFGTLAPAPSGSDAAAAAGGDKPSDDYRYLFLAAEFDPSQIPAPAFEKYEPAPASTTPATSTEPATSSGSAALDAHRNEEELLAFAGNAQPESGAPTGEASAQPAPATEPKVEGEPKPEVQPTTEAKPAAESQPKSETDPKPAADPKPAVEGQPAGPAGPAAPADPAVTPAQPTGEPAKLTAEQEAAKKAVDERNLAKKKEYERKIKQGKERVEELNNRFANWYYIISGDVYKKLHLSRAQLIKTAAAGTESAAPTEQDTPAGFKALKEGGIGE